MVASTGPRAAVRRGEQRVDFRLGEEGDDRSLVAFGRDGQYLLDRRGVIWMMQRRIAKQRVDRGQAGVARRHAVASLAFQVVEEPGNDARTKIVDPQLADRFACALAGES